MAYRVKVHGVSVIWTTAKEAIVGLRQYAEEPELIEDLEGGEITLVELKELARQEDKDHS